MNEHDVRAVTTGYVCAVCGKRWLGYAGIENDRCPGKPVDKPDAVNNPPHYGGADNPYEVIKVIEAWSLGFHAGNAIKYIARAGRKGDTLEDLRKARWYIDRMIELREKL